MSWGVAKLPTIAGQPPTPFVGSQGIFLSAFSENKVLARTFLLEFVSTPETMRALYDADPRNPAYREVFDQLAYRVGLIERRYDFSTAVGLSRTAPERFVSVSMRSVVIVSRW